MFARCSPAVLPRTVLCSCAALRVCVLKAWVSVAGAHRVTTPRHTTPGHVVPLRTGPIQRTNQMHCLCSQAIARKCTAFAPKPLHHQPTSTWPEQVHRNTACLADTSSTESSQWVIAQNMHLHSLVCSITLVFTQNRQTNKKTPFNCSP